VDGVKGRLTQLLGDLRERSGVDGSNERKRVRDGRVGGEHPKRAAGRGARGERRRRAQA
jgi:hypothetical protein